MNLRRFDYFLLVINVAAGFALLAAHQAPLNPPSDAWYLALFGVAYPYIFIVNLAFIAFWFVRKKLLMLLPFLLIISSCSSFSKVFSCSFGSPKGAGQMIKVMTYNVQTFDVHDENEPLKEINAIKDLIKENQPDVIFFQEFYSNKSDKPYLSQIKKELAYPFHHFETTYSFRGDFNFGVATFSKYPLSEGKKIALKGTKTNLVSTCNVDFDGQKVALFNVHLQSFKLGAKDYQFIEDIGDKGPDFQSSKSILKKLRNGYIKREDQAHELREAIEVSPYPSIVGGDFNDTPMSYAYGVVAEGRKDAFREAGFGTGGTYAGPLPSFRIDYILVDSVFQVRSFETIYERYSDHYPIIAEIELP